MILITGGAGFIGSNLVSSFNQVYPHEKIVICDTFQADDKWKNLVTQNLYDLILPDQVFSFLDKEQNKRQVNTIFHLGAETCLTETNVDNLIRNNLRFSIDLFEWSARNRVRFIYASTAATYGAGEHGFIDEDHPDYLQRLRPLNAYAWTKHLFDKVVTNRRYQQQKEDPLPPQCVGLKFFNVYGPNEYHKDGQLSIIAQFYHQILTKGYVKLYKSINVHYEDGQQSRDWVYVDDCIKVMLWLYDNPNISGLLNVGSGQSVPFIEIAKYLFNYLKKKEDIQFVDMPENMQKGYQHMTIADLRKLKYAGYTKPFLSYDEGAKYYIENYLGKENHHK